MDGCSGLPVVAPRNPGHLLLQTKLPGQEGAEDSKKESWVRAAYTRRGSAAEKHDSWQSCIGCGEARSTRNVTRLKAHLMMCVPYLLSPTAKGVPDALLRQRIARAEAAPPSGMSQSTLTVDKSSAKRNLMRAFADELTVSENRQLRMLFAEMVVATNLPHSWTQHAAVQKFFKALRPAFTLPSNYDLGTPLLLGVYAVIATKVNNELRKHTWLTITSDGWSRKLRELSTSPTTRLLSPARLTSWTSQQRAQSRSRVSRPKQADGNIGCHLVHYFNSAASVELCFQSPNPQ